MVLFPPCDVTAESIMSIYPPANADSTSGRRMFEPATPATKMQETRSEMRAGSVYLAENEHILQFFVALPQCRLICYAAHS